MLRLVVRCCRKISCDTLYILNCLAGKITKWHRWAIAEIWLLSRSLVSPRTRVLVTCSETERADHALGPWEPSRLDLILQLVLGATTSLGFSYIYVPMPCYFLLAGPDGLYVSVAPRSGLLSVLFRKRVVMLRVTPMTSDHSADHATSGSVFEDGRLRYG